MKPLSLSEAIGVFVGLVVSAIGWAVTFADEDCPLWLVLVAPFAFGGFLSLAWQQYKLYRK